MPTDSQQTYGKFLRWLLVFMTLLFLQHGFQPVIQTLPEQTMKTLVAVTAIWMTYSLMMMVYSPVGEDIRVMVRNVVSE